MCVIRRKPYDFYVNKKTVPTINRLNKVLNEEIILKWGREYLRKLLKNGVQVGEMPIREKNSHWKTYSWAIDASLISHHSPHKLTHIHSRAWLQGQAEKRGPRENHAAQRRLSGSQAWRINGEYENMENKQNFVLD